MVKSKTGNNRRTGTARAVRSDCPGRSVDSKGTRRRKREENSRTGATLRPVTSPSDESLLAALKVDAERLYKAKGSLPIPIPPVDSDITVTEGGAILKSSIRRTDTIYMVSNRQDYARSNPTKFGVRQVKVHTGTQKVQVVQTVLDNVPCTQDENVLLFVHGFDNSVADAALAAWKLGNNLGGIQKSVFFSWPSHAGGPFSYWGDYEIATSSVPFLVDCLHELSNGRPGKVHVVAHSMGCRLLLDSLIRYINTTDAVKLGQVYFIAGDVDQTTFVNLMNRVGGSGIATALTNIGSNYDYALGWSASGLVHNQSRCGLYPPIVFSPDDAPAFLSLLRPYPGKGNSHSYFNAPDVRADISNQVTLYHTETNPRPVNIRTTYQAKRGAKNTLVLRS